MALKMTANQLKTLLCSLVPLEDEEWDFHIEHSPRSPRRIRGTYIAKRKTILLYSTGFSGTLSKRDAGLALTGVALHEFAHHLHVTRHREALTSRFYQGKRLPLHGIAFKKILEELIGAFNFRYREALKGVMVYNRRRARLPPRFVRFDQDSQDSWRSGSNKEAFMEKRKRGSQDHKNPGKNPMVFENIMGAYCHYLKFLRSDDDPAMAPPLNTREKYILFLGMIAGRDRERGVWDVPEDTKLR